ncbi:MAG: TrkA C-terminal domain-containing protein [Phycisphaerae bacterium]|nr:TrkA C-terminal domain-containing protein [Phycisphaerae bacterium]
MIGVIAVLVVLGLSLVITRLATVALTLTGMSRESARFQARSAFTGTGFTTSEAEQVVRHPVRRRIVMMLMILRSAGLVTIIVSLILSFVGPAAGTQKLFRLAWIGGGVLVLWLLARSRAVDRVVSRLIERALRRWTDLDVRDYASLLRLSGPYTVMELHVDEDDWLAEKPLHECDVQGEGVLVLGILRADGTYLGAPRGQTQVHAGDTLIVYGRGELLAELDERRAGGAGDRAHAAAVDAQQRALAAQDRAEARSERQRRRAERDDASADEPEGAS